MNIINNPPVRTYYIAHTPSTGVVHNGYVDPGQSLTANQSDFEIFTDEAVYAARVNELGGMYDPSQDLSSCSIEQKRILLNAIVNKIRAKKFVLPLTYYGYQFDNDDVSRTNLSGTLDMLKDIVLPEGFTWRTLDNRDIEADMNWLRGLAMIMFIYRSKCYKASWSIKHEIDISENPELVNLEVGWPDPSNPLL